MVQKATLPEETRGTREGIRPTSPGPSWIVGACPEEPSRLGEVLLLPGGSPGPFRVFGRGGAQPDDPHPRVVLVREQPGGVRATPELGLARLSRTQLVLRVRDAESVDVKSVGQSTLTVNGVAATEATVHLGDVVELGRQILLVCVARSPIPDMAGLGGTRFPFGRADESGIVGESNATWQLRQRLAFAASQPGHLLITGESGTGKELVARALHSLSPRSAGPFVARSAATLPAGLVDAELFGNVRNYPHAGLPERPGLVGRADGGTLFLDELGELSTELQAHLLRVLDGGEYHPLGDSRTRIASFRLVAATNRDLASIKHDLLARLPLRIAAPTLQERQEDIPLLARHLLCTLGDKNPELRRFLDATPDGNEPRWSFALVRALVRHGYTTHVRELERLLWAAIERSPGDTLTAEGSAPASPLPPGAPGAEQTPSEDETSSLAPERIQACLDEHNGALEKAAAALGLKNRHVLSRLIAKHGLEVRRRPRGGRG